MCPPIGVFYKKIIWITIPRSPGPRIFSPISFTTFVHSQSSHDRLFVRHHFCIHHPDSVDHFNHTTIWFVVEPRWLCVPPFSLHRDPSRPTHPQWLWVISSPFRHRLLSPFQLFRLQHQLSKLQFTRFHSRMLQIFAPLPGLKFLAGFPCFYQAGGWPRSMSHIEQRCSLPL